MHKTIVYSFEIDFKQVADIIGMDIGVVGGWSTASLLIPSVA